MSKLCLQLVGCWLWGWLCAEVPARPLLAHTRLEQGHWQVWLAGPDGADAHPFTNSAWDKRSLRAVPGKPELLLRDNEGQVYSLDLKGPPVERKVDLGFDVIKDFDFHPQGGWLVAAYAPNALDNVCIWQVASEKGPRRLVIRDPYLNETPRWRPDGTGFLFAKGHAGKSYLCAAKLEDAKAETFVKGSFITASDPALSPDGRQVAFCGRLAKSIELWLCSARGQDQRRLYTGSGLEAEPAWSADSAWVYFVTWAGGNFRLARIRPDGAGFSFVSPEGNDCRCPVLVSDGGAHE